MKRFWTASVVVMAIILILEYVLHGIVLKYLYAQTMHLWRPQADIEQLAWLMILGYAIFSAVFVLIYTKGYEASKGALGQGLRYGFWIGLLLSTTCSTVCYVVMPIPVMLSVWWFAGSMTECILAGLAASLICKPK